MEEFLVSPSEFSKLNLRTLPVDVHFRLSPEDRISFTVTREGSSLIVLGISVWRGVPVREDYRRKGLLVECVTTPRVLVADPIKLGVPGFEATDESEVTLVWRLVFPASTPGAKIVRRATEKYRDAVAQMHRLVPTLKE